MRVILSLAFAAALTACAQFPELDHTQTADLAQAEYPQLLPLDQLIHGPAPRIGEADVASHEARAAGLRTRAARLSRVQTGGNADLTRRLAQLRQKAKALKAQPL